jgi:hypothetical protein
MNTPPEIIKALKDRALEIAQWADLDVGVRAVLCKVLFDHAELVEQFLPLTQPAPEPKVPVVLGFNYDSDGKDEGADLFFIPDVPPGAEPIPMAHIKHSKPGIMIQREGQKYRVQKSPEVCRIDSKGNSWKVQALPV